MFKFLILSLCMVLFLFGVSFFFVYQVSDAEKLSPYECGFNPFGDASNKFEISFYLVAILFIIFDLEITFLFPWVVNLHSISIEGIYCMFVFMFMLTMGFLYEWVKGALEWE